MDKTQIVITRVMLIGVIISVLLVLIGGIYDLVQYGKTPVDYHIFHGVSTQLMVFTTARGLVKIGFLFLVFTQIVRVAVAGWFFYKLQERFYVGASIFILFFMLISFIIIPLR